MSSSSGFDREAYQREKVRSLERRVAFLERHRERLERLLVLALRVAVAGKQTTEIHLLSVLEDMVVLVDADAVEAGAKLSRWNEKRDLPDLLGGEAA